MIKKLNFYFKLFNIIVLFALVFLLELYLKNKNIKLSITIIKSI